MLLSIGGYAGMAELADAQDLGSCAFGVQVQALLPAPNKHDSFDTKVSETNGGYGITLYDEVHVHE